MWPRTFAERLESWNQLRCQAADSQLESALQVINSWWFHAPWRAYHLHWDDQPSWPNPWQLLSDNIYCSLARGLGIMYTIALLDRADLQDAVLAAFDSDNLVLVCREKYILNWDTDQMLNISPGRQHPRHSVTLQQVNQKFR